MAPPLSRSVTPRQLLDRMLDEPNLVAAVQALPATALGKVIDHIGLEDAGEIVALATTDQLRRIFDDDLWRSERPGKDETFDADRFALWLQILLEVGEEFAARKLADLPEELVTLALHKNVLVVNIEQMAVAMSNRHGDPDQDDEMVEKALESCLCDEIDEYRIISRKHDGWDAILSVLLALDRDHHDLLVRVLDRLCFLTTDFVEEHGGLHRVLNSEEMLESDVAAEREDRRSEEGYVAPSSAASFLALARTTAMEEILRATKPDPVTAAYFRSWKRPSERSATSKSSGWDHEAKAEATTAASLLEILREAEVVPALATAGLLEEASAVSPADDGLFKTAMAQLRQTSPQTHDRRMEELAYVTQVLLAGCSLGGRAFRPLEAADAALATVSLGIDLAGAPATAVLEGEPVDKLFRIGWRLLFQDVVVPAAHRLEMRLRQSGSTREAGLLATATKSGKPWTALPRVRALATEDAGILTLLALGDECPSLSGLLATSTRQRAFIARRRSLLEVAAKIPRL